MTKKLQKSFLRALFAAALVIMISVLLSQTAFADDPTDTYTIHVIKNTDGSEESRGISVQGGQGIGFFVTVPEGAVISDIKYDGQSIGDAVTGIKTDGQKIGTLLSDLKIEGEEVRAIYIYGTEAVNADHSVEVILSNKNKIKEQAKTAVQQKAKEVSAAIDKLQNITQEKKNAAKESIKTAEKDGLDLIESSESEYAEYINRVQTAVITQIENELTALTQEDEAVVETAAEKEAAAAKEAAIETAARNGVPTGMDTYETVTDSLDKLQTDEVGSASYAVMALKSSSQKKNSIHLSWGKVTGASHYVVYWNQAGTKNGYSALRPLESTSTNISEIDGEALTKGTYYKFVVFAFDKDGNTIASSKTVYAATTGGSWTNPKKLTIKNEKKTKNALKKLKKGKTYTLNVSQTKADKKLKIKKYRGIQFESSDKSIASVSSKGKIKGLKKGTCYVYAYAQNGIMTKVKVTVK